MHARRHLAHTCLFVATLAFATACDSSGSSDPDPDVMTTSDATSGDATVDATTTADTTDAVDATGCATGETECDGECVDTATDAANCGACGTQCGGSESCVDGTCTLECSAPETDCGGECVDTTSDPTNCGTCGTACGATEVCSSGVCESECATGETACSGACVDTNTSATHCGACDNDCGDNAVCDAGSCACDTGFTACGMAGCVDVQTDAAHCGGCDMACDTGENGTASCDASACDFACNTGFTDCDGTIGCEVATDTDPANCGACGFSCGSDGTCNAGVCECTGTPTVVSITPAPNSHTMGIDENIVIQFSCPIDSTVDATTLPVYSRYFGRLDGTYTVNGATVTFDPTRSLRPNDILELTVTSQISSSEGAATPYTATLRVGAYEGTGTFTNAQQTIQSGFFVSAALGDLTGDTHLDLLLSGFGNVILVNNSGGTFVPTDLSDAQSLNPGGTSYSAALFDVDADGDLDVLPGSFAFGTGSTDALLYRNDGTGTFDAGTIVAQNMFSVGVGDLDGDGDYDIVNGKRSGATEILINNGAGTFTVTQSLGDHSPFGVALGDVDGDGDLDLFVGARVFDYDPMTTVDSTLYINDGTGTFAPHSSGSTWGHSMTPRFGDIDGDGDLDVVASRYVDQEVSSTDPLENFILINDGTGTMTLSSQTFPARPTVGCNLADLDADGDLDIIFGNIDTGTSAFQGYVWVNDGSGVFTEGTVLGDNVFGAAPGPLDTFNDDSIDMLTVGNQTETVVKFNQLQ